MSAAVISHWCANQLLIQMFFLHISLIDLEAFFLPHDASAEHCNATVSRLSVCLSVRDV